MGGKIMAQIPDRDIAARHPVIQGAGDGFGGTGGGLLQDNEILIVLCLQLFEELAGPIAHLFVTFMYTVCIKEAYYRINN